MSIVGVSTLALEREGVIMAICNLAFSIEALHQTIIIVKAILLFKQELLEPIKLYGKIRIEETLEFAKLCAETLQDSWEEEELPTACLMESMGCGSKICKDVVD